ncbi:dephospho-CoA kinase [Candidatus Pelagibacter sp. HIMB1542]|uniref:dephospho-CoA kinase n=1 Tax=Candidatus Pelagibacter sp. HIMB1542 TaxID=3413346 RepID=UPI003F839614
MIRIGIVGAIGSGKTFVANNFGHPVFNADNEVSKLYKQDKKIYLKLKKKLPKYIYTFPIDKNEITKAILEKPNNLKKVINIVHKEIKKKLLFFLKKNRYKKIVILDIPLLIENKIFNKNDILVFVDSKKKDIDKRLEKRLNFNNKLLSIFKEIQLNTEYKKKKSHFIIKNTFRKNIVKKQIKEILNLIG